MRPNPADGSRAQRVTGTVNLERPVPFETRLVIYSNEQQAVVGTPIDQNVSRDVITILRGQSKGTFIVKTNDNFLNRGQHITATISTFYAGSATTESLCVVTTPRGSCISRGG